MEKENFGADCRMQNAPTMKTAVGPFSVSHMEILILLLWKDAVKCLA